jgi:hypothetical protein
VYLLTYLKEENSSLLKGGWEGFNEVVLFLKSSLNPSFNKGGTSP